MPKIESGSQTESPKSHWYWFKGLRDKIANRVHWLNPMALDPVSKKVKEKLQQARKKGDFYWTEPMTQSAHIVELYAKKHMTELIDWLHWNQRDPKMAEADLIRLDELYKKDGDLNPRDTSSPGEIGRLKEKRMKDRKRDMELIAYLKLAKRLGLETWLNQQQSNLLDGINDTEILTLVEELSK